MPIRGGWLGSRWGGGCQAVLPTGRAGKQAEPKSTRPRQEHRGGGTDRDTDDGSVLCDRVQRPLRRGVGEPHLKETGTGGSTVSWWQLLGLFATTTSLQFAKEHPSQKVKGLWEEGEEEGCSLRLPGRW